jgi:hypothetical protein
MVFDGQVRSGKLMTGNARYFEDGSLSMLIGKFLIVWAEKRRPAGGTNVRENAWDEAQRFSPAVVR